MSRTTPRRSRMMFGGFRSRWMMPTSWMACSPSAIWIEPRTPRLRGQRALSRRSRLQVAALDELHRDVAQRRRPRRTRGCGTRCVCETLRASLISERKRRASSRLVRELGAQHLDRDRLVEHPVARLVDDAHAALAQHGQDLVARGQHVPLRERADQPAAREADLRCRFLFGAAGRADQRQALPSRRHPTVLLGGAPGAEGPLWRRERAAMIADPPEPSDGRAAGGRGRPSQCELWAARIRIERRACCGPAVVAHATPHSPAPRPRASTPRVPRPGTDAAPRES